MEIRNNGNDLIIGRAHKLRRAQREFKGQWWVMSAGGLAAPDITTKHVIVVLWFEVAVLCSKLLL